jgi:hypothetical protein
MENETNRRSHWLTCILFLLVAAAIPVYANWSRRSLIPVTATVVDYSATTLSSHGTIATHVEERLLIEYLIDGRVRRSEHAPEIYFAAFKTKKAAIDQLALDFPKGTKLEVYVDTLSQRTFAAKGMSELEKMLMFFAFCVSILFAILALRAD